MLCRSSVPADGYAVHRDSVIVGFEDSILRRIGCGFVPVSGHIFRFSAGCTLRTVITNYKGPPFQNGEESHDEKTALS